MKHLIIGAAGHVDHGKTSLIRALTGFDCDTHREERERGITIHLGFTHLSLSNGAQVGIIDVPGHRDFVHTMVGGASGVDLVLLVIAADGGVMPQTREHVRIMEILGVEQGIVVITRTDLVDNDELEICELDIHDFLAGTFLENAPIIKVSSKTGAGIENLRTLIEQTIVQVKPKSEAGVFRLFVDRVFSISGFGTVVTGTVVNGTLRREDNVFVLGPKTQQVRIRRMERHGEEVSVIQAGDRASLNLVGLERTAIVRGMVLSDRELNVSERIDATLTVHAADTSLGIWSQCIFHCGTDEQQARIHLIDRNCLRTGETAIVQIHLTQPFPFQHGDRFVVRTSSSDATIGGGEIIDAFPLHHRRRPQHLVNELELLAKNKLQELIPAEIRKSQQPLTITQVAERLNVSRDGIRRTLADAAVRGIVTFESSEGIVLLSQLYHDTLRQGILDAARSFRLRNPLARKGVDLDEIRGSLHLEKCPANDELLGLMIDDLVRREKLRVLEKTWLLFDDTGTIDPRLERNVGIIEGFLLASGMRTPLMSQIKTIATRERIGDKELGAILYHLTNIGNVVKIEGEYIHSKIIDDCRVLLIDKLRQTPEGLRVSDFRDLVDGNRRICLLLLAIYDQEGTTIRKGDFRFPGPTVTQKP